MSTALNYLQLTNKVLVRLNEVPLTSGNFASATGFQNEVQDAVLYAISDINTSELAWPFNHQFGTLTLATDGTQFYAAGAGMTTIDWESFFLNRQDGFTPPVVGKPIPRINYNKWLMKFRDRDTAMNASNYATPDFVFQAIDPVKPIGISPPSAQPYTVAYEYYSDPPDLALYSDIPNIPAKWHSVIIDGATYYAYLFRDNAQEADRAEKRFITGIQEMRTELINRDENMESDVLPHGGGVTRSYGYGFGF